MSNGTDSLPLVSPGDGRRPGGTTAPVGFPFGVVALALVQLALGMWWLGALGGIQIGSQPGMPQNLIAIGQTGQAAVWAFGLVRVISGVGLLLRIPVAWVLVMLVTGIGLALSIAGYAIDRPDDLRLLFEVVSAFYLNQPTVRAVFGDRGRAPVR